MQVEGGYQADPADQGNYNSLGQLVGTNRGISARFYEGIIKRPPTVADIINIGRLEAENLYHTHFWNKCRANEINNQAMANTIVDHHVNAGTGVRLAQETLNKHFGYTMPTDNAMGPITLKALNEVNPAQFVNLYNKGREDHYRKIGGKFLSGWLARLQKFAYAHPVATISTGAIILLAGFFLHYIN